MISNTTERNLIKELKKVNSTKKIIILKPRKCKIRKELTNEVKQILNLQLTSKIEDCDLNYDIIKIKDITINTEDLTREYKKIRYMTINY